MPWRGLESFRATREDLPGGGEENREKVLLTSTRLHTGLEQSIRVEMISLIIYKIIFSFFVFFNFVASFLFVSREFLIKI